MQVAPRRGRKAPRRRFRRSRRAAAGAGRAAAAPARPAAFAPRRTHATRSRSRLCGALRDLQPRSPPRRAARRGSRRSRRGGARTSTPRAAPAAPSRTRCRRVPARPAARRGPAPAPPFRAARHTRARRGTRRDRSDRPRTGGSRSHRSRPPPARRDLRPQCGAEPPRRDGRPVPLRPRSSRSTLAGVGSDGRRSRNRRRARMSPAPGARGRVPPSARDRGGRGSGRAARRSPTSRARRRATALSDAHPCLSEKQVGDLLETELPRVAAEGMVTASRRGAQVDTGLCAFIATRDPSRCTFRSAYPRTYARHGDPHSTSATDAGERLRHRLRRGVRSESGAGHGRVRRSGKWPLLELLARTPPRAGLPAARRASAESDRRRSLWKTAVSLAPRSATAALRARAARRRARRSSGRCCRTTRSRR